MRDPPTIIRRVIRVAIYSVDFEAGSVSIFNGPFCKKVEVIPRFIISYTFPTVIFFVGSPPVTSSLHLRPCMIKPV
nr:MAG TPA: hypothetical protein [Caudoviricetes sp.]